MRWLADNVHVWHSTVDASARWQSTASSEASKPALFVQVARDARLLVHCDGFMAEILTHEEKWRLVLEIRWKSKRRRRPKTTKTTKTNSQTRKMKTLEQQKKPLQQHKKRLKPQEKETVQQLKTSQIPENLPKAPRTFQKVQSRPRKKESSKPKKLQNLKLSMNPQPGTPIHKLLYPATGVAPCPTAAWAVFL